MGKTAYIFPGQGAQYPGMGREFYNNFRECRKIFDEANEALGFDIKKMIFEGSKEDLSITHITQPAILTVSMAIFEAMKGFGPKPTVMGGLSLGEYTALTAAEALSFGEAVSLVHKRGSYMQSEVPVGEGGMLAVMGSTAKDVEKFCDYVTESCALLKPANYNCPGQIAVGGRAEAIEFAVEKAADFGIRKVIRFPVSAPFHTEMLRGAGDKLMEAMSGISFKNPECLVISNCDASYYMGAKDIPNGLKAQVYNPVRWEECIRRMIADGVDNFVEIGPGKTLCGFIKRTDKSVRFTNIEDMDSLKRYIRDTQEERIA